MSRFEDLLASAEEAPVEGWDFSFLDGRVEQAPPAWDFAELVRTRLAAPVLDMGTGGGEFFSTFAPFPGLAVATEAWPPNVELAARRLRAHGAHVVQVEPAPDNPDWEGSGGRLPFADASFALVLNRHEAFSPTEVARILRAGGTFLTQQIGGDNFRELGELFGIHDASAMDATLMESQVRGAGLDLLDIHEERVRTSFADVGAIAWYVRAVPWEYPGVELAASRDALARAHAAIETDGGFTTHEHRILVEARKPADA